MTAQQLALPIESADAEREYHAHDNWSVVLCKRCGKVLWHPIHSRTEGTYTEMEIRQ